MKLSRSELLGETVEFVCQGISFKLKTITPRVLVMIVMTTRQIILRTNPTLTLNIHQSFSSKQ